MSYIEQIHTTIVKYIIDFYENMIFIQECYYLKNKQSKCGSLDNVKKNLRIIIESHYNILQPHLSDTQYSLRHHMCKRLTGIHVRFGIKNKQFS